MRLRSVADPFFEVGRIYNEAFLQTFLVNSVAPLKMTEAFSKHVAKSKRNIGGNGSKCN